MPESIQIYLEELQGMLEELNSKNERLFEITVTIRNYSMTKNQASLQLETLSRITQKNNCKLISLDYLQEQALASSLPLGYNAVPIVRDLPTSSVAVLYHSLHRRFFNRAAVITDLIKSQKYDFSRQAQT